MHVFYTEYVSILSYYDQSFYAKPAKFCIGLDNSFKDLITEPKTQELSYTSENPEKLQTTKINTSKPAPQNVCLYDTSLPSDAVVRLGSQHMSKRKNKSIFPL